MLNIYSGWYSLTYTKIKNIPKVKSLRNKIKEKIVSSYNVNPQNT